MDTHKKNALQFFQLSLVIPFQFHIVFSKLALLSLEVYKKGSGNQQ